MEGDSKAESPLAAAAAAAAGASEWEAAAAASPMSSIRLPSLKGREGAGAGAGEGEGEGGGGVEETKEGASKAPLQKMPVAMKRSAFAGRGMGSAAARMKLSGAINRVQNSVKVKRKYLVQSEESKAEIRSAREKLEEQGFLKKGINIGRVASLALKKAQIASANSCRGKYDKRARRFKEDIVESNWFGNFITLAIFVAGITVGAQTYDLEPGTAAIFDTLDVIVLVIFVVEAVVKIGAEGTHPHRYFLDGWNVFDFIVIVASFLPFGKGQVAILRLMRLLRLLKLVRALPKLRILVIGLLQSFQSIGYVMLMVLLLFYLWSVIGVIFLSENDPVSFGTLHDAFLSLWRAATGDDWTDMMYVAMYGCNMVEFGGGADYGGRSELCQHAEPMGVAFPAFYFIAFQVLASMMLINMFIGAILMSVEEAKEELLNTEVLTVKVVKARNLGTERQIADRPYVAVSLGKRRMKTAVKESEKPEWRQTLLFDKFKQYKSNVLRIQVVNWDKWGDDDPIGHFEMNLASIPFNRLMHFNAYLMDDKKHEFGGTVDFLVSKSYRKAVPKEAEDPDNPMQTIANRMAIAAAELSELKKLFTKRRKRLAEKKRKAELKKKMLRRLKSIRTPSMRHLLRTPTLRATEKVTPHNSAVQAASRTIPKPRPSDVQIISPTRVLESPRS